MTTFPIPPDEETGIELRNLSVAYQEHTVLRDVSLTFRSRCITAIIGPSGCGKSSCLNAINRIGDLVPGCRFSGEVRLQGANVLQSNTDLIALRQRVGMLFQRPNPFPLSIQDNLHLALRERGLPLAERTALTQQVLEEVGLWTEVRDRLRQSALRLSGGQQQRLCLARALALRPQVLLCDEPCSALDPQSARTVEELLAELKSRMTIILVTHNLAQARRLADDVAVFWVEDNVGQLVESGTAAQVFGNPRSPVTAAYIQGAVG